MSLIPFYKSKPFKKGGYTMPGAYAHITIANIVSRTLEDISGFPLIAIPAVLDYLKFCELGALSPDYPYLAIGDEGAAKWANEMHYTQTGQVIHAGVRYLKGLNGEAKRKCFSWLLGYSAHVVTDVSVHPVVQLKVGPYHGNEEHHRVCEMHQDAHIFKRMNLGDIGLSEHLDSGIKSCSSTDDSAKLDNDIKAMWDTMLQEIYPDKYISNQPDIDKWHKMFGLVVDNIAEEGNRLIPLARHVAVGKGLTYPAPDKIDEQYISNLDVPAGKLNYDEVFDRAVVNVGTVWKTIARAVFDNNEEYLTIITAWNLDTGMDENEELVFWG